MRFSLAARMPLSPLFSMPGATGTPARAWKARCDTKGLGGGCACWMLCWLWASWRWGSLASSWLGSRALLTFRRSPSVSYPAETSLESSS